MFYFLLFGQGGWVACCIFCYLGGEVVLYFCCLGGLFARVRVLFFWLFGRAIWAGYLGGVVVIFFTLFGRGREFTHLPACLAGL